MIWTFMQLRVEWKQCSVQDPIAWNNKHSCMLRQHLRILRSPGQRKNRKFRILWRRQIWSGVTKMRCCSTLQTKFHDFQNTWLSKDLSNHMRRFCFCCGRLTSAALHPRHSPRTGSALRIAPLCKRREYATTERSRRVISIVAWYHSVKLCALAVRALRSRRFQGGTILYR